MLLANVLGMRRTALTDGRRLRNASRDSSELAKLGTAVLVVACCSCGMEYDPPNSKTHAASSALPFRLQLFDRAVGCPAFATICYHGGVEVEGEDIVGNAIALPSTVSMPGTIFVFDIQRPNGVVAKLRLDVPLANLESQQANVRVTYSEDKKPWMLGRVIGDIEIPTDPGCRCQDIRFELLLHDVGQDGKLDTADDRDRRLNAGIIGRTGEQYCRDALTLPAGRKLTLSAVTCDSTGGSGGSGGSGRSGGASGGASGGSGGSGSGGGSGSSGGGSSSDYSIHSGCHSNAGNGCSDSDSGCDSDSGGGCEGDTGGSGCDGDAGGGCADAGSGCGDVGASGCGGADACRIGMRVGRVPNLTLLMVLVLLGSVQVHRMWRRGRGRRRRESKKSRAL
jgi:hypothetical protein